VAGSRIKLIAIDLDGTLLNSERRLTANSIQAVRDAVESGVHVCLASGRAVSTMFPYADQLGLRGPIVSCNGAYVLGLDREEIGHSSLPTGACAKVLDYAGRLSLHTNLYTRAEVFFSHDGPWAEMYRSRTGVKEQGLVDAGGMKAIPATKILFVDRREAILRHFEATSKLLDSSEATIALSEAEYIEFLPPGIDKSAGLKAVASALNLHREEVAAVGDYLNDLEMVRWAGFSGAVANGTREVREQADLVVASNDGDGVAEFIRAALEL
jgi:Cof subfamily protein (haloacid dehalogenase superfamily)